MGSSRSLSYLVMISLFMVFAGSLEAQDPPPFPTGAPPGPPAGEIQLLDVRGAAVRSHVSPPVIVAPGLPGQPGQPQLGAMSSTEQVAERDGVILRVTSSYQRTLEKFQVVATVETTDRGTIDRVTYTGPGRFGTTRSDAADRFRMELDTDEPFTLLARVVRPAVGRKKASHAELRVQVDLPNPRTGPLPAGVSAVAVSTAMRTGGFQYELKLVGDLARLPVAIVEAEWMLPEGFGDRERRSAGAATGYAVTGTFEKTFPAAVRVLLADGSIGLGFVNVEAR